MEEPSRIKDRAEREVATTSEPARVVAAVMTVPEAVEITPPTLAPHLTDKELPRFVRLTTDKTFENDAPLFTEIALPRRTTDLKDKLLPMWTF